MFRLDRLDPDSHTLLRRRQRPLSFSHSSISPSSPSLSEETHQPEKLMVSPRSGSYDRLESGMGPTRLGVRNFTWRKIAFCLALAVAVVWFLSPTEPKRAWGSLKTPGGSCAEG
jgi:hypothetical protein